MIIRLTCIFFLCIIVGIKTSAQAKQSFPCSTLNASKTGGIFSNTNYLNKIGILLKDTCSSCNRFDRSFYSRESRLNRPADYYHAIIVDPATAISIEVQLKKPVTHRFDSMKVSVTNASKKLKGFIRLYAGFVNDVGDTCVVIQYVTSHEYKENKYYSKQLDLIAAKNRPLRFIVFEKKITEWIIGSSFPNSFL